MKKNSILLIVAVAIMLPVAFWVTTLIKCEILTQKYYDDFKQAYTQNTMLGEMEFFKVLTCDENTAEVYYISKGMTGADVLTFSNNNGIWIQTSWKTIWSTSGSASDIIYPYWWHFIYGGL